MSSASSPPNQPSTVVRKAVMAVSGLILFGYVIVHLGGNLAIFQGPEVINGYHEFLYTQPALLWGVRLVLLAAVIVHIIAAFSLVKLNMAARPAPYAHKRTDAATSYAARTMQWTGPLALLFLIYHVLHITTGTITIGYEHDTHDLYGNLIAGFQVWYVSAFYIVAMVALGFHLRHGIWSLMQTLGINHPKINRWREPAATAIATVLILGFITIPVAIMAGGVS